MKQTQEELTKTFQLNVNKDKQFIELKFVSEDVGMDNVDVQSDLVSGKIIEVLGTNPDVDWSVIVDAATTKVTSMTKYSMLTYEKLIKIDNVKKVAILMSNTDEQGMVTKFALNAYSKMNKKVSIFTSRNEAEIWLGFS